MLLRMSGHDAHIAQDGLEAVDKAAQLSPDLIMLDIGLPKINGLKRRAEYERGPMATGRSL